MCYYNGQKVTRAEYIRLKSLEKEVRRYNFLNVGVQVGGEGYACDGQAFKALAMKSPALHSKVIRHEQTLYVQAQQSAACLAKHHVDARMARWLLRARDLVGSDVLPFTQEFVAEMLGVRRTSVSAVAADLQETGLIEYHRGKIQILNLPGLKSASCECYFTVKQHYQELLGMK